MVALCNRDGQELQPFLPTAPIYSTTDADPRPFSGPPELGVSGVRSRRWAGWSAGILRQDRGLVADGPVWPILVVVFDPSLQLFGRIRKGQEPVRVQALGSRKRPLNASMKALSVGFPGREKSSVTPLA